MESCGVVFRPGDYKINSMLWKHYLKSHFSIIAQALIASVTVVLVCMVFLSSVDRFYLYILLFIAVVAEAGMLAGLRIAASYGAHINRRLLGGEAAITFSDEGYSHSTDTGSISFGWRDAARVRVISPLVEVMLRQHPTLFFPLSLFSLEQRKTLEKYVSYGLGKRRAAPPAPLPQLPPEEYGGAVSVIRFVRTAYDIFHYNLFYFFRILHALAYDILLFALIAGFAVWMLMSEIPVLWPLVTLGALLLALNIAAVGAAWISSRRSGGQSCEIILTEEVFIFRDSRGTGRLHWQNIPAVRVTRGHFYLFVTSQGAVVLPRPALDAPAAEILESKIVKYRLDEKKPK